MVCEVFIFLYYIIPISFKIYCDNFCCCNILFASTLVLAWLEHFILPRSKRKIFIFRKFLARYLVIWEFSGLYTLAEYASTIYVFRHIHHKRSWKAVHHPFLSQVRGGYKWGISLKEDFRHIFADDDKPLVFFSSSSFDHVKIRRDATCRVKRMKKVSFQKFTFVHGQLFKL